jgi:hypothetical protein
LHASKLARPKVYPADRVAIRAMAARTGSQEDLSAALNVGRRDAMPILRPRCESK